MSIYIREQWIIKSHMETDLEYQQIRFAIQHTGTEILFNVNDQCLMIKNKAGE